MLLTLAFVGMASALIYTGDTQIYTQVAPISAEQMASGITFQVMANNDAHIGLFPSNPIDANSGFYEIVLGGWANTKSVIRTSRGGANMVEVDTPNINSGSAHQTFTIVFKSGMIDVQDASGNSIMSWTDTSPMLPKYMGFMTGWGSSGDWRYTPADVLEEVLFSMRVDTLMGESFQNYGGFGNYATTNLYTMTQFNGCGYMGQLMKLEYSNGNDIMFVATEDCFAVDGEGSLRIKTDMGGNNNYLYIAQGTTSAPGWRGTCFHNNQWGQGIFNCDGDAGQSCGMGLWGEYAANEITGCPSNRNGYWNDMGPNDCVNADVCIGSGSETITLVAVANVMPTPRPTTPPSTESPTPSPTPMPVSTPPTLSPTPKPVVPPTSSPSPAPTPMPVAPAPMTCKDISKLPGLTQQQIFDECKKTTYCKAKYKSKKNKASCKKLKCKKCKNDMACCNDNPEGCVYNPANTKQP